MSEIGENHPIYRAIDDGGGQCCDVAGVLRELKSAGYQIVPQRDGIMTEAVTVEVWIIMNEEGEYAAASEIETAEQEFSDNFCGSARRVVKLRVTMSPPQVVEADVDIPDDEQPEIGASI